MKSKSTVVTGAPWIAAAAFPIRMASSRTSASAATTELSNGAAFMLIAAEFSEVSAKWPYIRCAQIVKCARQPEASRLSDLVATAFRRVLGCPKIGSIESEHAPFLRPTAPRCARHSRSICDDPLECCVGGRAKRLDGSQSGAGIALPHLLVSALCLRPAQRI